MPPDRPNSGRFGRNTPKCPKNHLSSSKVFTKCDTLDQSFWPPIMFILMVTNWGLRMVRFSLRVWPGWAAKVTPLAKLRFWQNSTNRVLFIWPGMLKIMSDNFLGPSHTIYNQNDSQKSSKMGAPYTGIQ